MNPVEFQIETAAIDPVPAATELLTRADAHAGTGKGAQFLVAREVVLRVLEREQIDEEDRARLE